MLSPVSALVVVILAVMGGGGIGFFMWVLSCGVSVVWFVGGGID